MGAVLVLMAADGTYQFTQQPRDASATDAHRFVPIQRAVLSPPKTGEELYQEACANCHGPNSTGAPQSQVAFDVPLPDFTNCNFATRARDNETSNPAVLGAGHGEEWGLPTLPSECRNLLSSSRVSES